MTMQFFKIKNKERKLLNHEQNKFGEYLKALRLEKGMSLRGSAELANLSHSYIRDLEKGVLRDPSGESIEKLAKAYNIPVQELWRKKLEWVNNQVFTQKVIPIIRVRNKVTGSIHVVGTDSHDALYITGDGRICYYNQQNGEGTGIHGDYEFVIDSDDDPMAPYEYGRRIKFEYHEVFQNDN